jgi:hypothetical protein
MMSPFEWTAVICGDRKAIRSLPKCQFWRSLPVFSIAVIAVCVGCARKQPIKRAITLTFDYDFTAIHACSPSIGTDCIARFNVYEISNDKSVKLFEIPAPMGASTPISITGKSQPVMLGTGKHLLAVSAQMANGQESDMQACTTWTLLP